MKAQQYFPFTSRIVSRLSAKAQARLANSQKSSAPHRVLDAVLTCLGAITIGCGVSMQVGAQIGFGPMDVMGSAIAEITGLPFAAGATLQVLTAAIVSGLLGRRVAAPAIATTGIVLATIAVISPLIDTPASRPGALGLFILGVLLIGPGIGAIVAGDLGVGPYEQLTFAICDRTPLKSVAVARSLFELLMVCVGFALGGSVGLGTLITLLTIGVSVQYGAKALTAVRQRIIEQLGPVTAT